MVSVHVGITGDGVGVPRLHYFSVDFLSGNIHISGELGAAFGLLIILYDSGWVII